MECIPTKVETQQECFVPDQYQPGRGPKEWERHVDVKTPLRPINHKFKFFFTYL